MNTEAQAAAVAKLAAGLSAEYTEWFIRPVRTFSGLHLEAVRADGGPGLYAVITGDPDELRRELDAASRLSSPVIRNAQDSWRGSQNITKGDL